MVRPEILTIKPRAGAHHADRVVSKTEPFEELSQERDTLIMGLLELLSHRGKTKPVATSGHPADDL